MKIRAKIFQKFFRNVPLQTNHFAISDSNLQIQMEEFDDLLNIDDLAMTTSSLPSYIKLAEAKQNEESKEKALHALL